MKKYIITTNYHEGSQAFIQCGHASEELALRCFDGDYKGTEKGKMYSEWSRKHKSYVNLNVQDQDVLIPLGQWLELNFNSLGIVSAMFKEPKLNDTVTSLCFIAPTKLCENYHFAFRDLFLDLKSKYKIKTLEDFSKLKKDVSFSSVMSELEITYNKEEGLFYVENEEGEILDTYNPLEADFFIKFRFLSLK